MACWASHDWELHSTHTPSLPTYNKSLLRISVDPWPIHHLCIFSSCSLPVDYPFSLPPSMCQHPSRANSAPSQSSNFTQPHPLASRQHTETISLTFLNSFICNFHNSCHTLHQVLCICEYLLCQAISWRTCQLMFFVSKQQWPTQADLSKKKKKRERDGVVRN